MALALVVDYGGVLLRFPTPGVGRCRPADRTVAGGHLVERFRLFLMPALGESILVTRTTFADSAFDLGRISAVAFISSVTL